MNYPKNENGMYVLSIWDQEDLHNVAEDVIVGFVALSLPQFIMAIASSWVK